MREIKDKTLIKIVFLLAWFIFLLIYFIASDECPGEWYCLHGDDGMMWYILTFGVAYVIVLIYEVVKVLLNPIKKVVNKLAHKIKMWDFRYGWNNENNPEIIQYTPPVWINSAEAGLLIHRYASTTDMISLIYKREAEKLIDIKTQQDEWEEFIIIEKKKDIWKTYPKYEENFFLNLFQNGDTLELWEWEELSKMCDLSELEAYWINKKWFIKPRFSISFNMFFYTMIVVLVILTACWWWWIWISVLWTLILISIISIISLLFSFFWIITLGIGLFIKKIFKYISIALIVLLILVCSIYFFLTFDENPLSNVFVIRLIFFVIWMMYLWRKPFKLKFTKEWNLLKKHLLWFRKFILTCDEKKINSLLKADPLFYDKIIPYAIVFWVETDLLKKLIPIFDDKIDPKDWNYKSRKALWKF